MRDINFNPHLAPKLAKWEVDETSILQIQLGVSQLERERRKEKDEYERRRGATREEVQKIRERKSRQELERDRKIRNLFTRVFRLLIPSYVP